MIGQEQLIVSAAVGIIGLGGFLAGVGGTETVQEIINDPEPYGLEVMSLEYKNGKFHQLVIPVNADVVPARWTARITRGNEIICSGGDDAPYDGDKYSEPAIMTPAIWTGQIGCKVELGDVALATWTYKNINGHYVTLSSQFTIDQL